MWPITKAAAKNATGDVSLDVEAAEQSIYNGRVWSKETTIIRIGTLCCLEILGLAITGIICYSVGKASCENP